MIINETLELMKQRIPKLSQTEGVIVPLFHLKVSNQLGIAMLSKLKDEHLAHFQLKDWQLYVCTETDRAGVNIWRQFC